MEKRFLNYAKIVLGGAVYAVGFQFFCYPNAIVTGGVTGIAMIINFLTGLPVGVMSIVMNIPLFLLAWRRFGLHFMVGSLVGMLSANVAVDLLSMVDFVATTQPLMGAVYGGVFQGLGIGLVYTAGATTGGTDIIAKFLRVKYQHINFATFMLVLDAVIIAAFALIFDRYDSALYAIIGMFISSRLIDTTLYGTVNSKVCYIITDETDAIKNAITVHLDRGVTYLHGEGAWSGKEKKIILCVIRSRQIVELKRIIKSCDPHAFLIVSDSHEVFGEGFTHINDEK